MMSKWTRKLLVIVRAADRDAANEKYSRIDRDGAGDRTFNMPLATPANPTVPVAWATNTHVTEAMVQRYGEQIQDFIDAGRVAVYRLDLGEWTVATALADTTKKAAALIPAVEATT